MHIPLHSLFHTSSPTCIYVYVLTSLTPAHPAGKLLTLLVNGVELCDPLGDKNVWGSMFNITEDGLRDYGAIMLATKVSTMHTCNVCLAFSQ